MFYTGFLQLSNLQFWPFLLGVNESYCSRTTGGHHVRVEVCQCVYKDFVREQKCLLHILMEYMGALGYFKLDNLNIKVNPLFISPFPNLPLLDGLRLQGPNIPARSCWLRILGSIVLRHPEGQVRKDWMTLL